MWAFDGTGTYMSRTLPLPYSDGVHRLAIETVKAEESAVVILRGESDIATLPKLEVALGGLELDGAKSVHLHVDELDFADAATIRRLIVFAQQAKQGGYAVKTCGASPLLRKVLYLLEVQDDLGLS